jgi:hypothetical protein
MQATVTTNFPEFQAALREWAATTTRELSKALSMRLFYVLLRVYVLLSPQYPQASRNATKQYLDTIIADRYRTLKSGKRKLKGKAKQLMRVMLIAQGIRKKNGLKPVTPWGEDKGEFAETMKKNIGKLRRRGQAQGYVKAAVVKALRALNMKTLGVSFTQFGTKVITGKRAGSEEYSRSSPRQLGGVNQVILTRREVSPNAALVKIASDYGIVNPGNVGVFKTSKGEVLLSGPGFTPHVGAELDIKVRSGNDGAVSQKLSIAINQALADETDNIRQHMAAKAQEVANAYS